MKILEFLKRIPLAYWILIVLVILLLIAGIGRADKKLYDMIRRDIEKDVRANEETLFRETERLVKERNALIAEREKLVKERTALKEKVASLERKKNEIEARLNAIVVPSDDVELAEALKKRGYRVILLPKR